MQGLQARDAPALEAFRLLLALGHKNPKPYKRVKSGLITWVDVSSYLRSLTEKEALAEVVKCVEPLGLRSRGPNILTILFFKRNR